MILQETILVKLNSNNIKHYEKLNYEIPRYIDNYGNLKVKRGTIITVQTKDLQPKSNIKVLCRCDNPNCVVEPKLMRFGHTNIRSDGKYYCPKCSCNTPEWITRRKQIISGKNNPFYGVRKFGKDNPRYDQNLTDEDRFLTTHRELIPGYSQAMKKAKERDGKCIICEKTNKLQGHHIQNCKHYPELKCNPDNIVTLCFEHHTAKNGKSIHNIYGKHPTKEQFEEFIKLFK